MAEKVDLKKTLDCYRAKPGEFRILDVPSAQYLMLDGHGDPNTQPYRDAVAALYPVAYKLKFASKKLGRDYVVPPLEALWSAADLAVFTTGGDKSRWDWTLLLMVPEWVPAELFASVATPGIRLETLDEGLCVQTLHLGPFDDEAETLARMHDEFIPASGLRMTGRHHEIYLSDPRRTAPATLRTLLRQPVEPTTPKSREG